jgi:hypothetical protein
MSWKNGLNCPIFAQNKSQLRKHKLIFLNDSRYDKCFKNSVLIWNKVFHTGEMPHRLVTLLAWTAPKGHKKCCTVEATAVSLQNIFGLLFGLKPELSLAE